MNTQPSTGNDLPLEMKERIWDLEAEVKRIESEKGSWIFAFGFACFIVSLSIYGWATTPYRDWSVNEASSRPEVTFIYSYWWKYEKTTYGWGRGSDGTVGWILEDKNGRLDTSVPALSPNDYVPDEN